MAKQKKINIRQIAEMAGVSTAAVSALLSGAKGSVRVSDTTRTHVLGVCKKMGYEPNIHAQRLFNKRSCTLGVVFPPFDNLMKNMDGPDPGLAGIIQGCAFAAMQNNYQIVLVPAKKSYYEDKEYEKLFRSKTLDGFVIWGINLDEDYLDNLAAEEIPFVLVQSHPEKAKNKGYQYVGVDDYKGSLHCTENVIKMGHKKIGYITGRQWSSVGYNRLRGYKKACENHNVFNEKLVIKGDYSFLSGMEGAAKILEKCPSITAICCGNDTMALGAIRHLEQEGIKVPEDISITGADAGADLGGKPLTSYGVPTYEMATLATQSLINFLENKKKAAIDSWKVLEPIFHEGRTLKKPSKKTKRENK